MNAWHSVEKGSLPLLIYDLSRMSELFDPCKGIRYKYGSDTI